MQRDLIYDVGMHRGEDTAYYLRKGYRVVAFEADPDLVAGARERFSNEIAAGRVTILSGAIARPGEQSIAFYKHPEMTMWGTTDEDWVRRNTSLASGTVERVDVPVIDFGAVLAEKGTPWYAKIDIEGADHLCLEELRRLDEPPVYVSIESEKKDWDKLVAEIDALSAMGYDEFAVRQQQWPSRTTISTRSLTGETFTYRFETDSSGAFGEDIPNWTTRAGALREYARIFRRYELLGDDSLVQRFWASDVAREAAQRLLRTPLPGWYDTHARRSA